MKSDSLDIFTYKELSTKFHNTTELKHLYSRYYLAKAKNNNDTLHIARGYRLYTFMVSSSEAIKYSDSIIEITREKNYKSYPNEGYLLKAYYLYQKGQYKNSLNNYLTALPFAIKKKHSNQLLRIRQAVGSLKNKFGDYEEASKIFKEHLTYIESLPNFRENRKYAYLEAIFNISNNFLDTKKLDSANIYIQKGIVESLQLNDSAIYYDFISASGYSKYLSKQYIESLNILNGTTPYLNGYSLGINHYYKGKCYYYLNDTKKMFYEFKKADSVYQSSKDLFPELRDIYEYYIDYYKQTKQINKQLEYLEKLISIDTILDKQNNYLSSEIVKKYDTPILLREKDELKAQVESLHKQNKRSNIGLVIALISISIIIIILIYYYRLQKKYKQKFVETIEKSRNKNDNIIQKTETIVNGIGISQEIINEILLKLDKFEKTNAFLNSHITVANLAKEFNTNTTYLSKIINTYRNKNFSTYLKELRVNYAIEQLQTNSLFRKYSVKAIAHEIGFNNVDYFSKAFYKVTGIKPSYFIKELEKQEKNTHNL